MKQIVFRKRDWENLTNYLLKNRSLETGAYALYRISQGIEFYKVLVEEVIIPEKLDFYRRSSHAVAFTPEFTEKTIQACEKRLCSLLDIHTHPWSKEVNFSTIDDTEALNTKIPYFHKFVNETGLAFIVFGENSRIVKARFWGGEKKELINIDRIRLI
ncbi:MAG: hypothetical protein R3F48_00065 [Candidatus Zixiibacteriota bacterium]